MTRLLDGATYPAVMVGSVLAFLFAVAAGVGAQVASYAAVAVAAVAILGLEAVRPYRPSWQPDRATVATDAAFLALIQMLLPFFLSAAIVFGLAVMGNDVETVLHDLWPHRWPTAAQVVLMLVVGDALRYWLHRAFHTWQSMWRFHAVHHSPKGLYWLNVGRFHPIEKGGQLILDSLPFVIVGVEPEVLAGYFVFYAVNGFFQHSNCRVRLGLLNWIVSGPELHRWHHSRRIVESNNNYGNNLIVWDVIFGTRFLPENDEVGELGLINRAYPQAFLSQMTTVFEPGLDKEAHAATQSTAQASDR